MSTMGRIVMDADGISLDNDIHSSDMQQVPGDDLNAKGAEKGAGVRQQVGHVYACRWRLLFSSASISIFIRKTFLFFFLALCVFILGCLLCRAAEIATTKAILLLWKSGTSNGETI